MPEFCSRLPDDLSRKAKEDQSFGSYFQIYRQLKQTSPEEDKPCNPIRIALLGTQTLDKLQMYFEVQARLDGYTPQFFLGDFNQYTQDMLDKQSNLYKFNPQIIFLAIEVRSIWGDIYDDPVTFSVDQRKRHLKQVFTELRSAVGSFLVRCPAIVVIHNLEVPAFTALGIHEGSDPFGTRNLTLEFNQQLQEWASQTDGVYVLDYDALTGWLGKSRSTTDKMRLYGGICISDEAIPALISKYMGCVKMCTGRTRKCIVLDLDNTLWGGIVGEDGFDGIALGPTFPGNVYMEFQRILLSYYHRGIILAINSRNNPEDALKVLQEHPYQLIREDHCAAMRINWNDKASNMRELAIELNIGLNSMVFIDDDPVNRQLVQDVLPEVLTVDMPSDPAMYGRTLLMLNDLEMLTLTWEDKKRGEMYAQEKWRRKVAEVEVDLRSFIKNLDLKVSIQLADSFTIPRISQLTQRTNQFNMTTRRYNVEDIGRLVEKEKARAYGLSAKDRFGDYGLVGVAIILPAGPKWRLDTYLMSCRVLGRGIEKAFLSHLAKEAVKENIREIIGEFIPSAKNKPAENFFNTTFSKIIKKENGLQTGIIATKDVAAKWPEEIQFVE